MATLAVERTKAPRCDVQANDTLAAIAQKHGLNDWKALAEYNWGTAEPEEVNRALFEQVGCREVKVGQPQNTVLDPAFGPKDSPKQILIPSAWKPAKPLALRQTHVITVRKLLPAPSICIDQLSKWFIPESESCDILYSLQGVERRADKVDMDVWASNYCQATEAPIGSENEFHAYTYAPRDEVIFHADKLEAGERTTNHAYNNWRGESTAKQGVLTSSKPGGAPTTGTTASPPKKRYINVAHSPYTVQLRYYKKDEDKSAQIVLKPFWPVREKPAPTTAQPNPTPVVQSKSLKIEWAVRNCTKLRYGKLTIYDKGDLPVFEKPLGPGELKQNDPGAFHSFD